MTQTYYTRWVETSNGRFRFLLGSEPEYIFDMILDRAPGDWVSDETLIGQLDTAEWPAWKVRQILRKLCKRGAIEHRIGYLDLDEYRVPPW